MIQIDGVSMPISHTETELKEKINKIISCAADDFMILRKSVDARKKADIRFVYSVALSSKNEKAILKKVAGAKEYVPYSYSYPSLKNKGARPVVIGSGPAGIFAALVLAKAGACPVVIERGSSVENRQKKVDEFFDKGTLDPSTNVQFGEGGAGTFSDGKLNSGIHSPLCATVLREYVRHGAPETILYDAKPHIGTDNLKKIAKSLRKEIISLGGTFMFNTLVSDIEITDGKITAVYAGNRIETDAVILATGHSARDTFLMLYNKGIQMISKPFSVGVRIEHPQIQINKSQYGDLSDSKFLPPADYKLVADCYTFCMCPGGYVVAAASEEGGIVTNGMSNYKRDAQNANSALLVGVDERDFESTHPLAGIDYQRKIEQTAYKLSGSFHAPCQTVEDFIAGRKTKAFKSVTPSYRPGVCFEDINRVLPEKITDKLKSGIQNLSKKLSAFSMPDAVLTAPETRSSSPVRIIRDKESLQANVEGLFPCGEGAGHAGGIMSSAVDGIKCATKLIEWKNSK